MKREKIPVTMKMKKSEIYEAGRLIFQDNQILIRELNKLSIVNASLVNSLKYVLAHISNVDFDVEDGSDDEPPSKFQKEVKGYS